MIDEILKMDLVDKKIDSICVDLSERLIDDIPAHDPRWAESVNKSKSLGTNNIIIVNQLKRKITMHEYYLNFLKKFSIWEKVILNN